VFFMPHSVRFIEFTYQPMWVRGHCRINPPRFPAECRKRRLNHGSFVLLCFRLSTLFDLYLVIVCLFSCIVYVFSFCMSIFPVLLCLSVPVTASEMTHIVSGGTLNYSLTPLPANILLQISR